MILPKILYRIQIWVSKIGLWLGQNFKHKKKTKNLKKYCAQNSFKSFSTHIKLSAENLGNVKCIFDTLIIGISL